MVADHQGGWDQGRVSRAVRLGHKPAYLSPSGAGGMSAMTARVSEFCAVQQLEVSAINRHNRRLFDHLVRAPGYRKAKRLGGRRAGRGGTVNEPCGTPGAAS